MCAALGQNVEDIFKMPLLSRYNRRITTILPAVDVLLTYDQLLPEECADLRTYQDDRNTLITLLKTLCGDVNISEPSRRFISLVISSYNMFVFDVHRISAEAVFAFV